MFAAREIWREEKSAERETPLPARVKLDVILRQRQPSLGSIGGAARKATENDTEDAQTDAALEESKWNALRRRPSLALRKSSAHSTPYHCC